MTNISKISKFFYGSIFMIVGIGSIALSGYILYNTQSANDREKQMMTSVISDCRKATRDISGGFSPSVRGNRMEFRKYGSENWKRDISSASIIIDRCDQLEVVEYCFGECKPNKGSGFNGTLIALEYTRKEK